MRSLPLRPGGAAPRASLGPPASAQSRVGASHGSRAPPPAPAQGLVWPQGEAQGRAAPAPQAAVQQRREGGGKAPLCARRPLRRGVVGGGARCPGQRTLGRCSPSSSEPLCSWAGAPLCLVLTILPRCCPAGGPWADGESQARPISAASTLISSPLFRGEVMAALLAEGLCNWCLPVLRKQRNQWDRLGRLSQKSDWRDRSRVGQLLLDSSLHLPFFSKLDPAAPSSHYTGGC